MKSKASKIFRIFKEVVQNETNLKSHYLRFNNGGEFTSNESNDYFEVWADYYQKLNIAIPEGQLGCNPGGISTSDKLRIIGTIK